MGRGAATSLSSARVQTALDISKACFCFLNSICAFKNKYLPQLGNIYFVKGGALVNSLHWLMSENVFSSECVCVYIFSISSLKEGSHNFYFYFRQIEFLSEKSLHFIGIGVLKEDQISLCPRLRPNQLRRKTGVGKMETRVLPFLLRTD